MEFLQIRRKGDKVLGLSELLMKILHLCGVKEGMFIVPSDAYKIYFTQNYDMITVEGGEFMLRKSTMRYGSYMHEYIPVKGLSDEISRHFIRQYFSGSLYVFYDMDEANNCIEQWNKGFVTSGKSFHRHIEQWAKKMRGKPI